MSSRRTFSCYSRITRDSFTVGFCNNPDIENEDTEDDVCTFKSASGEDNASAKLDGLAQNLNVIASSTPFPILFAFLDFLYFFLFSSWFVYFYFTQDKIFNFFITISIIFFNWFYRKFKYFFYICI